MIKFHVLDGIYVFLSPSGASSRLRLTKAQMRLNAFESSHDIISAAVECTQNRRLAHLLSASETKT